jgi:carbon monoxide dehydrogenase subunit G
MFRHVKTCGFCQTQGTISKELPLLLQHEFVVPAHVDVVWAVLLDPEKVAPCMPGATLTATDGSTFTGTVKVKLGPVSLLYKGKGEFLETDEAARKVVIKAGGKDSRGNGTAAATVTVTLTGEGASTHGSVDTDLTITGKPAQFGRGMITEVGGKILTSFADCLAGKLSSPAEEPATETAGGRQDVPPNAGPQHVVPPASEPRHAAPAEGTQALDLLDFAGGSIIKRAAPVAGAVLAVLIVVMLIRKLAGGKG